MAYRFSKKPKKISAGLQKKLDVFSDSVNAFIEEFQTRTKPFDDFNKLMKEFYSGIENTVNMISTPVSEIDSMSKLLHGNSVAEIIKPNLINLSFKNELLVSPYGALNETEDFANEVVEIVEEKIINNIADPQNYKNKDGRFIFSLDDNGKFFIVNRPSDPITIHSYRQISLLKLLTKKFQPTEIFMSECGYKNKRSVQKIFGDLKKKAMKMTNNGTSLIEGHQRLGYKIRKGCRIIINSKKPKKLQWNNLE